jgi:predicted dehydrogenase
METSRRRFLQASALAAAARPGAFAQSPAGSANDRIQIGLIGAGIMGQGDATMALQIPGNALVAVADLYDGRLTHAKELWGNQVATTRDYREVLGRPDIDAVIIATPDHWHSRIALDALAAGKHVYCEKPMVQKIEQGQAVVEAARRSGKVFQVGSQYVSSVIYHKTREMIQAGAIGELNMVEAWLDRNTAIGAWQYSIPPDASPVTVDWDRFLGSAPKRPYDPLPFFRWRNYREFGTGLAGDLFVHLLSGLHFSTGALGPARVFSIGGLRFWKDGRDVPDVMLGTMDYAKSARHPEFTFALRVNLKASAPASRFGFRFVGSEGTLLSGDDVTYAKQPKRPDFDGTIDSLPNAMQKEFRAKWPKPEMTLEAMRPQGQEVFSPPPGYNAHLEHHRAFYNAIRGGRPVIEDAVFGLRAAGPALLANISYFENRVCHWDPERMVEKKG